MHTYTSLNSSLNEQYHVASWRKAKVVDIISNIDPQQSFIVVIYQIEGREVLQGCDALHKAAAGGRYGVGDVWCQGAGRDTLALKVSTIEWEEMGGVRTMTKVMREVEQSPTEKGLMRDGRVL